MKPTFSHLCILSASVYANFLFCKDKYAAPFKTWGEKQWEKKGSFILYTIILSIIGLFSWENSNSVTF